VTLTTIKNSFAKCGFPKLKFTEDEENDWHSLQHLGVQFQAYMACDSALEVVGYTPSTRCWTSSLLGQNKNRKKNKRKMQKIMATSLMYRKH
jgi:hypothetical protein